jgi:hypothetical protein
MRVISYTIVVAVVPVFEQVFRVLSANKSGVD